MYRIGLAAYYGAISLIMAVFFVLNGTVSGLIATIAFALIGGKVLAGAAKPWRWWNLSDMGW